MVSVSDRLRSLNVLLPPAPEPAGHYLPAKRAGDLLFISGQTPTHSGVLLITGKLGADVSIEAGQEAARSAILNCLAILQSQLGSLDAVESVVMVSGYIASAPGFHDQPLVLNGASLLLEEVFGEAGQHARVALGVAELPGGAPVEVQLIVRLRMPGK